VQCRTGGALSRLFSLSLSGIGGTSVRRLTTVCVADSKRNLDAFRQARVLDIALEGCNKNNQSTPTTNNQTGTSDRRNTNGQNRSTAMLALVASLSEHPEFRQEIAAHPCCLPAVEATLSEPTSSSFSDSVQLLCNLCADSGSRELVSEFLQKQQQQQQ